MSKLSEITRRTKTRRFLGEQWSIFLQAKTYIVSAKVSAFSRATGNEEFNPRNAAKICSAIILCLMLQGCLGKIVGTTADVAIEVVKIPFKVGGAVVDVATGSGSKKQRKSVDKDGDQD